MLSVCLCCVVFVLFLSFFHHYHHTHNSFRTETGLEVLLRKEMLAWAFSKWTSLTNISNIHENWKYRGVTMSECPRDVHKHNRYWFHISIRHLQFETTEDRTSWLEDSRLTQTVQEYLSQQFCWTSEAAALNFESTCISQSHGHI